MITTDAQLFEAINGYAPEFDEAEATIERDDEPTDCVLCGANADEPCQPSCIGYADEAEFWFGGDE